MGEIFEILRRLIDVEEDECAVVRTVDCEVYFYFSHVAKRVNSRQNPSYMRRRVDSSRFIQVCYKSSLRDYVSMEGLIEFLLDNVSSQSARELKTYLSSILIPQLLKGQDIEGYQIGWWLMELPIIEKNKEIDRYDLVES